MRIYITYSILFIALLLSSCEKAIDLKLNDTSPQYVIEGVLTNETGSCKVLISETKKFTDDNTFIGVSNAQVSINTNGANYNLNGTAAGIYQNNILTGVPGQTYQLNVSINGKTFTGICTMPQPVALDSIYLVKDNTGNNKDGSTRKYATVQYKDPVAIKNYYRFVQYINGRKEQTVFVDGDEFTNGQMVNKRLDYSNKNDDPAKDIRPGNQITIEMLCLDAPVYKYWYSLTSSSSGDGNNAAPANPLTNIQGGALGYFSAHTIQRRTLVAP